MERDQLISVETDRSSPEIRLCDLRQGDEKKGKLSNKILVSTVMSNIGLGIALREPGIEHTTTKVDDLYALEEMQAKGAAIGGEESGYVIFVEHHITGDGIITGLQILAAIKKL
jgi:phosphoglucosamine mutase